MTISVDEFSAEAAAWLEASGRPDKTVAGDGQFPWGEGESSAAVFHALSFKEVQRNIIRERVLGLPGEPRLDKGHWPVTPVPRICDGFWAIIALKPSQNRR